MLFGTDSNLDLAQMLFDLGGVQFGSFDMPGTAGQSPIYVNPRILLSEPKALQRIARLLATEIHADRNRVHPHMATFAAVTGVPMGGLHLATAYAIETATPLVFLRMPDGENPVRQDVEGRVEPGQTVLIMDDLMTGGRSILEAASRIEMVDMRVRDAIVLIDREQGGGQRLHDHGYHVTPILSLKTMLNFYLASELIDTATFDRCLTYLSERQWENEITAG